MKVKIYLALVVNFLCQRNISSSIIFLMDEKQKEESEKIEETEGSAVPSVAGEVDSQGTLAEDASGKITQPVADKPISAPKKLLFAILIIGVILIVAFYILLLWGLLSGNVSNPIFEAFGIMDAALQGILLKFTNAVFGIAALVMSKF